LNVVVRRTFLEIEDHEEQMPLRRDRALSDTILFGITKNEVSLDFGSENVKNSDQSTSAGSCAGDLSSAGSHCGDSPGDDSPRSSNPDTWSEMESSRLPVCTNPVPYFWMPVCTGPVASFVAVAQSVEHPIKTCSPVPVHKSLMLQPDGRTTIMLRNLPSSFSRARLLEVLKLKDLSNLFDFVYVPVDFVSGACLGYAFVNLVDHESALLAISKLQGFDAWHATCSQKIMEACWSDPHQGANMLIERFRNSRVMHGMVPDEYKPALFQDGVRVSFPKHTKRIRPPYSGNVQSKGSRA